MIYVDGASLTFGYELDDPAGQAWPAVLGRKLNLPVHNSALNCKSFDHIVFDTINFCSDQKPRYIIIAFGPIMRNFIIRRETNHLISMSVHGCSYELYNKSKEFMEFNQNFYRYWSNYAFMTWRFLQQVVLLQQYFKKANIPYLMINADDQSDVLKLLKISSATANEKDRLLDAFHEMDDDQILLLEKQLNLVYNQIDHDRYHDFSWCFSSLIQYTGHPNVVQHKTLAEFIMNLMQKK